VRLVKYKHRSLVTMDDPADDVASEPHPYTVFRSARPHYMEFNTKNRVLFAGIDPVFADLLSEDGLIRKRDPRENRIKSAIRSAALNMQKEDPSTWHGVVYNDAKSMTTLAKSINGTWEFEDDIPDTPSEEAGGFKLSLHVTQESEPRLVPTGWIGRYQTPTDDPPDVVISRVETSPESGKYQITNISVVVDARALDKATNRTVYLKQKTVQEFARDFAEIVPFVRTDLANYTNDDVLYAQYTAERSVMSLARSARCRQVEWKMLPDDVEDARPAGSQRTGEPITQSTPDMEGLGTIPVTFVPFYG
jgi:hypothetical protein